MSQENKEYIEGIFNYCDRWCEKCKFTANCLLFTQESRIKTHEILHNGDLSNIDEVLNKEFEDFKNDDDEEDYKNYMDEDFFDSINDEKEELFEHEERRKEPKHPINDLVDEYFIKSHSLIESLDSKFNFLSVSKEKHKNPVAQKAFDDFEVLMWYHTLMGAKIKRALHGLAEASKEDDDEIREIHQEDMNGSAKVGMISIKRSIKALNKLHETLPEFSNKIEEVLVLLGKILNYSDELFPDCMEFKRPGFDD